MSPPAKRVIVIGLDGAMPEMLFRFRSELPAMARLMDNGFFAPALSSPPVDTPTNWTSIATGAWTGTHGITSFNVHLPGEPLSQSHASFGSGLCQAEFIWRSAERQGMRSILVNYPMAWPPSLQNGVVIGGDGLISERWTVSRPVCYSTANAAAAQEFAVPVALQGAKSWKNLPSSRKPPLEAALASGQNVRLGWSEAGSTVEMLKGKASPRPEFLALIYASSKAGYNRVRVCRSRDASKFLAELAPGGWSPWVYRKLGPPGKRRSAAFRFKLLELSRDGTRFKLYRSLAHSTEGWGFPSGIEKSVIKNAGPYVEGFEMGCHAYRFGYIDIEQHPEQLEIWCDELARITNAVAAKEDWQLLFAQIHAQDSPNHDFLGYLMPEHPRYTKELAARSWEAFRRTYIATDRFVNAIVEANADAETAVCVVSDHGACPTFTFVWTVGALARAGLVSYDFDSKEQRFVIDWSRTKVFLTTNYVWVNTKGREPHGIVEPGLEFDRVLDEAIAVLDSIRDPKTGKRVVALVARKEDAAWLGQWGDRVGDAVYFLAPGYSDFPLPGGRFKWWNIYADMGEVAVSGGFAEAKHFTGLHHSYLPTARLGPASNRAVFILSGAGVVRGTRSQRDVNLVDVAPTLSALLGIRPPAQSEGRILTEALCRS